MLSSKTLVSWKFHQASTTFMLKANLSGKGLSRTAAAQALVQAGFTGSERLQGLSEWSMNL